MDYSIVEKIIRKKSRNPGDAIEYIKTRIQQLEEQSEDNEIGINIRNNTYNKYIGAKIKIRPIADVVIDQHSHLKDDSIIKSIQELKPQLDTAFILYDGDDRIPNIIVNSVRGNSFNILYLIEEMLKTIRINLCNGYDDNILRTKLFLSNAIDSKPTTYSELKDKNLCACVEISLLFHNILQIMGYNSDIVFGTLQQNDIIGSHAYNLLHLPTAIMLIDIINYIFMDENGLTKSGAAVALLTTEEYDQLKAGKKISKDMADFFSKVSHIKLKPKFYTYGIGCSKSDKDKIYNYRMKTDKNFSGLFDEQIQ